MKGMGQYIITRLLLTPVTILVLLTFVFLILRVIPGDPVEALLGGRSVPPEVEARHRAALGLDKPIYVQYWDYLSSILHGDFGRSLIDSQPVTTDIIQRFPTTLELAIFSILIATFFGLGSGVIAGRRADRLADHAIRFFNIGIFATPIFWLGLMMQLVFGVWLHWFPVTDQLDILHKITFHADITGLYTVDSLIKGNLTIFTDALRHLVMPSLTLGIILSGFLGRITRVNLMETLDQDYIRTARSKGLSERNVVYKHALRNAFIPIMTVLGLQFAILLGGAVLTESVFNWQGLGHYLLDAITKRDYVAIQGTVVFIALFISIVNFLTDLTYSLIDPRVKY
ncbi:ABC transporter permease [Candidatus Acetothermia bacterium]|nr:ABC transporter permease [Candidatus Acetothermia bacterium]MBI3659645.1 ABC transporter permease [Candidatus Acetothermia bacterium]